MRWVEPCSQHVKFFYYFFTKHCSSFLNEKFLQKKTVLKLQIVISLDSKRKKSCFDYGCETVFRGSLQCARELCFILWIKISRQQNPPKQIKIVFRGSFFVVLFEEFLFLFWFSWIEQLHKLLTLYVLLFISGVLYLQNKHNSRLGVWEKIRMFVQNSQDVTGRHLRYPERITYKLKRK